MNKAFLRLPLGAQMLLIKQLSILMRAGVPIFSALAMLKKQSRSKTIAHILDSVISDVENGQYLSNALAKFKYIFGELTINIISVGEITGNLSNNLEHLALTLKKKQTLRHKIVSASVYPIFIIIATVGITIMLTVFIFPKIIPVFESIHYDLPWSTRFLIFINHSVQNYGLHMAGAVIVLVVGTFFLLKNKKVHTWYDAVLLRIPFINQMVRSYNTTNICRTLGLLLNSGVTVIRAFHITSDTTVNLVYKKALTTISENIAKGEIISASVARNPRLFPIAVSQMIEVGESTGKLSETFTYLADIYEEEIDGLTKNVSTTLEPLLLMFMGVLVGFIAISIITPIYGITQHLTPK
jgi:type IV pilus assembly protein PilC